MGRDEFGSGRYGKMGWVGNDMTGLPCWVAGGAESPRSDGSGRTTMTTRKRRMLFSPRTCPRPSAPAAGGRPRGAARVAGPRPSLSCLTMTTTHKKDRRGRVRGEMEQEGEREGESERKGGSK